MCCEARPAAEGLQQDLTVLSVNSIDFLKRKMTVKSVYATPPCNTRNADYRRKPDSKQVEKGHEPQNINQTTE